MAQKTDLNISPYYDDFDSEKNFYKVLFKPGYPVQARELTTLQSILQDQVKSFGSHIFKEGSVVIPGNIAYDGNFNSVKLNPTNFGVDISLYINNFIGKKIVGQISGTTAIIQFVSLPDGGNVEDLTIYVKYLDSDNNFQFNPFEDGESLIAEENITYGNTTINAGTPFASLISLNATSVGSSASIGDGVYFIRGYFVNVSKQTIILDNYTNTPSYRVGLKIDELILSAGDDSSLYDPSKGFTNYAAPGADRFKIDLTLTKKLISDLNDTDFVELLRVENGKIKIIEQKSQYNIIKDYMAERTYDESGDYTVEPFNVSVNNSLNDRLGNNGLFFNTETTEQKNTPSEDLMCLKISPGKAYVRGYDIEKISTTIIDVDKPRDTARVDNISVPFEMGNIIKVNTVSGTPKQKLTIDLLDQFVGSGTTIGNARVYNFSLTDASYTNNATNWNLYLYDIQTYTTVGLNTSVTSAELPATSFVKGKSSGASGFAVSAGGASSTINLRQTSGTFSVGEQLIINGIDFPRTIRTVTAYSTEDIKSVKQSASSGFSQFTANCFLERFRLPNGITQGTISGGNTLVSPGKFFTGVKVGSIIRYQTTTGDESFNRVTAVPSSGTSLTIAGITTVSGVFDGAVANGTYSNITIGAPVIRNENSGFLYAQLPDPNVSSVNLSDSLLTISEQITGQGTNSSGVLQFNTSAISGISSAFFESFDQERYSVHYSGGGIGTITSDQFVLSGNTVTISGLSPSETDVVVNTTLVKNGIQSKVKTYNKSNTLTIARSKYPQSGTGISSSIGDGLTYNQFYGLRVQDEEISLNYPDVVKIISVYESFDSSAPTLDQIQFGASANVSTNAIIGENIIGSDSKAIARVVSSPSSNILGVVYLNSERFTNSETVTFEESNITTEIESIIPGKYKDITNSYRLDKGQKDQYYDYSKIVRNKNTPEPSKQLLVVFDYYSIPSNDSGDVFTVLSYDKDRFTHDIPFIGPRSVRSSDTLDFRPRVPIFTSDSSSPFDFSSRSLNPTRILSPNESSLLGYDYYLARIDKLYLDKNKKFILEKGISSNTPKAPDKNDAVMEIATIKLPPYLYNPANAVVTLKDNRRYTMRDIGLIEDRVENLERVTSLSLLEVNTQTLQIQDSDGNNRFKSGFFVDDFKNYSFINRGLSSIRVNTSTNEITPVTSRNSLKSQIAPESATTDENLDFSENFKLLDPNVVKTGKAVTLKYDSIGWIEQAFATTVENVNPFNVIVYSGDIKLSPEIDNWVRTVQLPDKNISVTLNSSRTLTNNLTSNVSVTLTPINTETSDTVNLPDIFEQGNFTITVGSDQTQTSSTATNTTSATSTTESFDTVSNTDTTIRNVLISSSSESFMRSRNIQFSVSNIKPSTQFYQFLDGNSGVDFIPKLIEITNTSGAFAVGETVIGTFGGANLISFRVATPNHKYGPYNAPSTTYTINPYIRTESIASGYSQSSTVLNVDTVSLSEEAQGKYSGYLLKGMQLVGQTSRAVATVSDLRLISDNFGDLIGTFFLRDPNTIPTPTVRISTGTKTFKLSSSSTNDPGLPGSSDTSFAETNFNSDGTLEQWENTVTATTRNLTTKTVTNLTTNTTTSQTTINTHTRTTIQRFVDPLAQSFVVGGNIEAPDSSREGLATDDSNGAFLTAVDLFFAKKDSGNATVKVEIRTMELGTPTRIVIGNSVTLRPNQVNVSSDASIATKVTFDEPIYLPPGREYAIVIISENSDQYEMWTAIMGEKTVNTKDLPDVNAVTYSKQFAMGSLFKSQNGSIWTANQYQDLKFKLYKAQFIENQPGTAFFYNPTLDQSNGYVQRLGNNPLTTLPKTGSLGITTTTNLALIADLSNGRKIVDGSKSYVYGYVVGTGSSVATAVLTTGGSNYVTDTNVSTYNITGNGSGLVLSITATNGTITGITTVSPGNGYAVGDVVGIVTSTVGTGTSVRGRDARITISAITGLDTLYLGNIQGDTFTVGAGLSYYNNSNTIVSLASTIIRSPFTPSTNQYSGNYLRVEHFDHGMYGNTNKLRIYNAESSTAPVVITSSLTSTSTTIAVGDTSNFGTFEGVSVSATNPGYVKIGNEIIKYQSIGSGFLGTITRGIDSTISIDHDVNSLMYKYELNGVSLRRINTTHDISDLDIGLDGYYLEIDRTTNGVNRSADGFIDGNAANAPQLQFTSESTLGGSKVLASENILYSSIVPTYDLITPGSSTSVSAFIRTVSGTSVSGNETSFLSNEIEPIQLNALNTLRSVRLVCSKENETEYLNNLPRNKSFTTGITLSTTDSNLSPIIFLDTAFTEFISSRLNSPVSDYALDGRSNSILDDPHAVVYVSRAVNLVNPATSLKVILSAYRHESADFRVLYSLFRPDSSEVEQSFELFPGYDNLISTPSGLSVVDPSLNNGKPDSFVSSSLDNQFKEYEFTADNLGLFNGYVIKIVMSGTNQAYPPRIKELRTIAVR
jgi:hypothetical protein